MTGETIAVTTRGFCMVMLEIRFVGTGGTCGYLYQISKKQCLSVLDVIIIITIIVRSVLELC